MSPQVITTIADLRAELDLRRGSGGPIGLVPTMGYLHAGHASLMDAARQECRTVVASIFVNPLQFSPKEDLSDYPRDLERDTEVARRHGVDLLFVPSEAEMYPSPPVLTEVTVPALSGAWEGAARPSHFSGVATVVAKLFAITGPCRAFFGEKDFQQLVVITQMAADLSFPVTVVGCPIVREPDGLALSSRNIYLGPEEREAATVLRLALDAGEALIRGGNRNPAAVMAAMANVVHGEPLARLDYAVAVDPKTLEIPAVLTGCVRLLIAARVGRPRLIDNCGVIVPGGPS